MYWGKCLPWPGQRYLAVCAAQMIRSGKAIMRIRVLCEQIKIWKRPLGSADALSDDVCAPAFVACCHAECCLNHATLCAAPVFMRGRVQAAINEMEAILS